MIGILLLVPIRPSRVEWLGKANLTILLLLVNNLPTGVDCSLRHERVQL